MRDAVIEPKVDFHRYGIERTCKREMPVSVLIHRKRPNREKRTCEGCTLTGPRLFASLWPVPEPRREPKVGQLPIRYWAIGPHACTAPTKSEARAMVAKRYGPIPFDTDCYEMRKAGK